MEFGRRGFNGSMFAWRTESATQTKTVQCYERKGCKSLVVRLEWESLAIAAVLRPVMAFALVGRATA